MAIRGVIRRLWVGERDRIRDHLLRLGDADRMLRFGGYASAAHIAAYCEQLDWSRVLVVGYVTGDEVRGLGQLELIGAGWPRAAELAVSVERPFQNRGIGTALLRRLVVAARNRLIERVYMICVIDNGRAVRMARRLDGAVRFRNGRGRSPDRPGLADTMDMAGGAAVRARADRPGSWGPGGTGAAGCSRSRLPAARPGAPARGA